MGATDDAGFSWTGEFADKKREDQVRRFNWEHDFARLKVALILGGLGFLAYSAFDYYHLGFSSGYFGLLIGRTLTAAIMVTCALAFSPKRYSPRLFDLLLVGELSLSTTFFFAELLGADPVFLSYAHALLIVLVYFLVIPDRFINCLIATTYTSVTFVAATWLRGDSADLIATGVLMLVIGILLGVHQRYSLNIELRKRFLTIEEQAALNRKMMAAERIAQDNADLFRNVFETTPFPLLVARKSDSRLLHVNQAAIDFFGIDVAEIGRLKGRDFLYDAKDAARVAESAKNGGHDRSVDIRVRTRDGDIRWVEALSLPFDFHGEPAFLSGLADVTERYENQQVLEQAKHQAEAANRAKSEFLANVSHELRTPLNAILGFATILKGPDSARLTPEMHAEYLSYIHTSGEHLLQLINDLLDLSKIEAGEYKLNDDELDLKALIKESCRIMGEQAEAASLSLEMRFGKESLDVQADARCMRQFLLNTLSNAIKFTEKGGHITVTTTLQPDGSLRLAVSDTGIGIAQKDLDRAMTPFCQVDGTLARQHKGTGLGLPLAKKMAELHGGRFDIQSNPGEGTEVSMTLPAERVLAPDKAVASM